MAQNFVRPPILMYFRYRLASSYITQSLNCKLTSVGSAIKKLLFATIFFGALNALSQNIDSLRHLIKNSHDKDTTYILALNELAFEFHAAYPDSSLQYAIEADSLSRIIGYNKGSGRALRVVGIYHYIKSDYAKALRYLEAGLDFSQKANDKTNAARCYSNIGIVASEQGNYGRALEYQILSLKIREQIKDKQGIAVSNNSIGLIYREQGNDKKAMEYFVDALPLAIEVKDKRLATILYQNIGVIYTTEKKYPEALKNFKLALQNLELINDKRLIVFVYGNLAEAYIDIKETDEALPFLDKAYEVAKKSEIVQGIGFIEEIYAKYYNAISDFNLAYRYASESQAHAKKIGNLETWRNASKQKYLSAYGLGKHKEALENYDLFVRLRDSLKNAQVNRKIVSLEYELKEEKATMEQERKELQFAARQARQNLLTAITGGVVIVTSLIIVFFLYKLWSGRTKREMARIRERISRDIHDDMGSNLSTINILSGVAIKTLSSSPNGPKTKEILGKISIMSNLVMESIDEIVWSIDPQHDSFEKVIARMRLLGAQLENQGVSFSFKVNGDPSKCTLSVEQRHDFYLIYKEAITNIAKYAKCKNVIVTLVIEATEILLSIKDDGIGFDVDTQLNGNGLNNMKNRSKNLTGRLKIESALNQGTTIELEFPV